MVKIGEKYGRLTVLRIFKKEGSKRTVCECVCDCGKYTVTRTDGLENGNTKSCGCLHSERSRERAMMMAEKNRTHGETGTRLYRIWRAMKNRCNDPKHEAYERYGGSGIKVCDEWEHDFSAFSEWSHANGYEENLTIDRIDNKKGYSKDNCRWVSMKVQQNNKSNNRIIEFDGEKMTLSQWGEATGLSKHIIHDRLANGWSVEDALTTPIDKTKSSCYRGKPIVVVDRVVGWEHVLDAARNTVGKDSCCHEPSHQFKINILVSQHSPIQALQFKILFKNLKSWTSVHFVRHFIGISGHWVQSQRDDRNELRDISRDDMPQSAPVKHLMLINAQEIIYISRRRLCMQASPETRQAWQMVVDEIKKTEPELASVCVPECIYRGFCPEFKSCGYCKTAAYEKRLKEYHSVRELPVEYFDSLKTEHLHKPTIVNAVAKVGEQQVHGEKESKGNQNMATKKVKTVAAKRVACKKVVVKKVDGKSATRKIVTGKVCATKLAAAKKPATKKVEAKKAAVKKVVSKKAAIAKKPVAKKAVAKKTTKKAK